MIATLFALAAIFAYSLSFASAFAIPKLLVLSLGLLPMAYAVLRGARVSAMQDCTIAGLLFVSTVTVSAIFAEDRWLALVGRYNGYAGGVMGVAIALFYHVAAASAGSGSAGVTREKVRWLRLIAAAGAVLGTYALAQGQGLTGLPVTLAGARAIGTIGSPTDLGLILAMILPLALAASPVYAVGVVLGLVAAGSRGSLAAAAVGSFVYFWRYGQLYADPRRARRVTAAIGLVLAAGAAIVLSRGEHRFSHSDAERIQIWRIARATIAERPLFGHGPDSFGNAFKRLKTPDFVRAQLSDRHVQEDAHNDVLQVLATLGLLGLMAYALLAIATFRQVAHLPAAFGAMAAFFVNAKVNPVPLEAMVLAGVIVGLACSEDAPERQVWFDQPAPLLPYERRVFAAAASVIVIYALKLGVADHYGSKRDLASLARAVRLNPYELDYKSGFVNRTIEAINATHDATERLRLFDAARAQALEGVKLRPACSTSWYIAGVETMAERELGLRRDDALAYLDHARRLDPYFGPIRAAIVQAKAL